MSKVPTFAYEQQYWNEGIELIAGVDEVGMGALAGPVTAAAVVFDSSPIQKLKVKGRNLGAFLPRDVVIRDSKTMSARHRERADTWLREQALAWAVGEASVAEIEELNIRQASHLAMKRALDSLGRVPDLVLVDGTFNRIHPTIPAVNIVDGDATCFSIAAASIVAKVVRDAMMVELDNEYPAYGFAAHKGYGSLRHLEALKKHGATPIHRVDYAPVAQVVRNQK